MNGMKRILAVSLVAVLCLCLFGCGQEKPVQTAPSDATEEVTRPHKPILPIVTDPVVEFVDYTPVYVSTFGSVVLLATVPIEAWDGEEPDCAVREISAGGRISCGGKHEKEEPITQVIILEDLIPQSCAGWFRDMVKLEKITGTEKIHTHNVKDMSYMFYGCEKLKTLEISFWNVNKVENMTEMFGECTALDVLPRWYEQE